MVHLLVFGGVFDDALVWGNTPRVAGTIGAPSAQSGARSVHNTKETPLNLKPKRFWLKIPLAVLGVSLLVGGWIVGDFCLRLTKVSPTEDSAFQWPYYLYTPAKARHDARNDKTIHILVIPNNTGTTHDDPDVHERKVLVDMFFVEKRMLDDLGFIVLTPAFPRPESNWQIYTHALDRDAIETDIQELHRLDLRLLAMIDNAIYHLSNEGWQIDNRVLMWGFSASGMFVNRFVVLHPDRVQAAVIGSPGGWPIAPTETWDGKCLRYPIGLCDFEELTGRAFDLETYKTVPQLFFIGDQDDNDSVPGNDSYEDEDRALIFDLFGKTPVERWSIAEDIYQSIGANAEFRVYPDVGHELGPAPTDASNFFSLILQSDS